ncbi:MAG: hypothetical protein IPJ34_23355 [Myxococcales bacterium]|nr:hypothetical protein [Myxococcales bacterium]
MRWFVLSIALVACAPPPRVRPPVPAGATAICETCVGTLEGHRVGVSNLWERSLAGPDGVVRKQPSAQLSIWRDGEPSRHEFVVVGTRLTLGGVSYEVVMIDLPPHEPGSIALRRVP